MLGLPFLFLPFDKDGIEVYTPVSANKELTTEDITEHQNMADNPFPQLGYESGMLIAEALLTGGVKDTKKSFEKPGSICKRRP